MAYYEKFDPPFVLRTNSKNAEGKKQPSNAELMDLIEHRLSIFNEGDISRIHVEVRDSVVVLSGSIGSNHLKDLISKFVEKVPGVKSVTNRIVVASSQIAANAQ
ncbi:MAG: BON domain-containing protein [Oligoflexales bacterium]